MAEKASLEFRLRMADETRNYLVDKMKYNDLMSAEYKKTCMYLNYVEHLLILVLIVTVSISICAFASLVCVPVCLTSSAVGIKICAIINKSEVLISKALIEALIVLFVPRKKKAFIKNKELNNISNN